MATHHPTFYGAPTRRRIAAAVAATTTTAALVGSLLLTFDAASPTLWLAPSPQVLELVSRCDTLPTRHAREECARTVVAVLLQRRQQQSTQLAGR